MLRILTSFNETLNDVKQCLDEFPLTESMLDELAEATLRSIIWNEEKTSPVGLDQNRNVNDFRQRIRHLIHRYLISTEDLLSKQTSIKKLDSIIRQWIDHLQQFNRYREQRRRAYSIFTENSNINESSLPLVNVDQEEFRRLHFFAHHLREESQQIISFLRSECPSFDEKK